ncbi:MAG: ATP-binding cassette domain-containing protein [Steroidobacteraceae bacterium]
MSASFLKIDNLRVHFPVSGGWLKATRRLKAVDGVSLEIARGEALGIVGESGCGKSTLARAILKLVDVTAGQVVWLGKPIESLSTRQMRPLRDSMQIVFQDPLASLNPRMTVGEIVSEPLRVHRPHLTRAQRKAEVGQMLERVGLSRDQINRYPHEFSGGQCQRIGIARAMILQPKLLVCDEPVSALDVSIQAQIINLLEGLKRESGTSILFVSHNLAVVRRLCERVLVLYLGKTMEVAPSDELFRAARHPYTLGLLASVPIPDPDVQPARLEIALSGELPSPLSPPSGCVFRTRCKFAIERCATQVPVLESASERSQVACHRWRELRENAG